MRDSVRQVCCSPAPSWRFLLSVKKPRNAFRLLLPRTQVFTLRERYHREEIEAASGCTNESLGAPKRGKFLVSEVLGRPLKPEQRPLALSRLVHETERDLLVDCSERWNLERSEPAQE